MLVDAALGFVNHLLATEVWARDRLKPFSGQTVRLEIGALSFPLQITPGGLFTLADKASLCAVSITFPADAPIRALIDRTALLAQIKISGSAELAEALSFLSRNLRWDIESDLSTFIGDIAARRVVQTSLSFFAWQQQQALNLATNLAEFLTEESPSITRRAEVSSFCTEVSGIGTELSLLEQRIARLEP